MSTSLPYLLYPSLFLDPRAADEVWRDFTENGHTSGDPILNTQNEYDQLIQGIEKLAGDSSGFRDFQQIIFNANYDRRLTPDGFLDNDKNLGVNLYDNYLSQAKSDSFGYIKDENGNFSHRYIIQPINPKDKNLVFEGEYPIIYISSPFSVAKAVSNIANKGDRPPSYDGGYMISYIPKAGYGSVISGQKEDRFQKISTEVFYPFPYAVKNEISIRTSSLDDFILFDNSHKNISLESGDDIAIPSLAAFLPSIQFGDNIINSMEEDSEAILEYVDGQIVRRTTVGKPIQEGDIKYRENLLTPNRETNLILNPYVSKFHGSGAVNYAQKTDIFSPDQNQRITINVGGQSIYGKSGNDLLYGFDPLLYAKKDDGKPKSAIEIASSNVASGKTLALKFLDNKNTAKTAINWTPILLSGGAGKDTFKLGALGKIDVGDFGRIITGGKNGDTLYTILGDKNSLSDTSYVARLKHDWADSMSSDEIVLTASYDYINAIVQSEINADYSKDGEIDSFGVAQSVTKGAKVALDTAKIKDIKFPELEAFTSVVNLGIALTKLFAKSSGEKTISTFKRPLKEEQVVPPGNWSNAITFPDWDPLDRLTIDVIPVLDESNKAEQWEKVSFSMNYENNQATGIGKGFGYTLSMSSAVDGTKPIAYLADLQDPNLAISYGYKTYNFFEGREQFVDPIKDMTYLGVLSSKSGGDFRTDYYEPDYDLEIKSDSSLFLWNSQALRDQEKLLDYRSQASNIQIGIDTRQYGWFTDIQVFKEGPTEGEIDFSSSTFNYYDSKQRQWNSMSVEKLINMPANSLAQQANAKARFTYWTSQDTEGNKLMNLAAADADNSNDVEFYKSRDDGSVLDPITGKWLAPSDAGYEQAALSEANYAGALSVQETEDGSTKLIVDEGYKLAPFIETTFADGRVDHIFAFDDVHANDPEHTRDSMVQIDSTGVIRFEDVIGGDYDYNDAVLDPTLYPELAALLASSLFN